MVQVPAVQKPARMVSARAARPFLFTPTRGEAVLLHRQRVSETQILSCRPIRIGLHFASARGRISLEDRCCNQANSCE
jgi:hypothetical protein